MSIYGFYFSLKIFLEEYLGNKSNKYFSIKPFSGVLQIKCLLKCLSFKMLPPKNFLIACLFHQNLSGRKNLLNIISDWVGVFDLCDLFMYLFTLHCLSVPPMSCWLCYCATSFYILNLSIFTITFFICF